MDWITWIWYFRMKAQRVRLQSIKPLLSWTDLMSHPLVQIVFLQGSLLVEDSGLTLKIYLSSLLIQVYLSCIFRFVYICFIYMDGVKLTRWLVKLSNLHIWFSQTWSCVSGFVKNIKICCSNYKSLYDIYTQAFKRTHCLWRQLTGHVSQASMYIFSNKETIRCSDDIKSRFNMERCKLWERAVGGNVGVF